MIAISFKPDYNYDLGYVLGTLYGDGSASVYQNKKGYTIYALSLEVKDYNFAFSFANALTKVFKRSKPIPVYTWKSKKGELYQVHQARKEFILWFKSLTYSDLREMLLFNTDTARGFINGFWDSEGSYSGDCLKADCIDIELMNILKEVLDTLDIGASLLGPYFLITNWRPEGYNIWRLYILKEYHVRFLKEIGFRRWLYD